MREFQAAVETQAHHRWDGKKEARKRGEVLMGLELAKDGLDSSSAATLLDRASPTRWDPRTI